MQSNIFRFCASTLLGSMVSMAAFAAPKVVFSLPKGSKGTPVSLSSQILCAEAPKDPKSTRSVTLYLNDAGVTALEKFTKPLVGKNVEYSICGGKNQRLKLKEPLNSNILSLGLLPEAKIECLDTKPECS